MRKIALAAALLVSGHAYAASNPTAGDYYQARSFMGGFILRGSMVCSGKEYDWKAMSMTGQDLMGGGDMHSIASAYPKTVKSWNMQGADAFNREVMNEGISAACKVAWQNTVQARATLKGNAPAQPPAVDNSTPPETVTGVALDARCEQLWALFDAQHLIIKEETPKPGISAAFKSANRVGEATAKQILAQGCPVEDPVTFQAEIDSLHALSRLSR
jgi:hypothetical protein